MTTPNTSNLETNQSPKVSVIDSKKSQRISFIDDISDQKLTEVILIEAGEEKKKNITDKSTCECTVTCLLI